MPGARGEFYPVQTFDFGQTGSPLTFNETVRPKPGQLGMLVTFESKVFRLVHLDVSAVTAQTQDTADGAVVFWADRPNYIVSPDFADSDAEENGCAGGTHVVVDVSLGVDAYIMVQVGGVQAAVVVAASTVASDHMSTPDDTALARTSGELAPVATPYGTALTTRATTTTDNGVSLANSSAIQWNLAHFL